MKKKLGDFTIRETEMFCRKHISDECRGCPFSTDDSIMFCLLLGDKELDEEIEVGE